MGDLFELFRHDLQEILRTRRPLLDRLAELNVVYVPGNHDSQALTFTQKRPTPHPFFDNVRPPFVRHIAGRKFKFMHGHEVDPFRLDSGAAFGRMLGSFSGAFEVAGCACILSNDAVADLLLEVGEAAVWAGRTFGRFARKMVRRCSSIVPNEELARFKNRGRTHHMLHRYFQDKQNGLYDVAIMGHTHKAGIFDTWYFNCGSWTGGVNNFLRILPDGTVNVFDWSGDGPRRNNTRIGTHHIRTTSHRVTDCREDSHENQPSRRDVWPEYYTA